MNIMLKNCAAILGALSLYAAGAASAERRGQSELDVLLRVQADHERRQVDQALADAENKISITDQYENQAVGRR